MISTMQQATTTITDPPSSASSFHPYHQENSTSINGKKKQCTDAVLDKDKEEGGGEGEGEKSTNFGTSSVYFLQKKSKLNIATLGVKIK